jgi:hypothetical protein
MGYWGADGYKMTSWVRNRGLPVHNKRCGDKCCRVVYLEEFWAWAEKNRSFIDFSKMEPLALGKEPAWVAEQRRHDIRGIAIQRNDPWTPDEDQLLCDLVRMQRFGYLELSERLNRSCGAIQRRLRDLGVNERPVRVGNREKDWTDESVQILADGIRNGVGYMELSMMLGKSEKAVRGKVYQTYITENADKVRALMGNGKWGDGAPVPTVAQGRYLASTRRGVTADLERLVAALKLRQAQIAGDHGFAEYWQRFMCMRWDPATGCTAGCAGCDECEAFERIQPQYCSRCGVTFFERQHNRFCGPCRLARKKTAARRWYRAQASK